MPYITENDLKLDIKNNIFKNLYFLFGDEKYLINHYTNELIDKIISENNNSFNFQLFKGDELDIDKLEDAIEALPLFSKYKCVKLVDLNVEDLDSNHIKQLKNLIKSLPESTVLVISQSTQNVDLKKSSKWKSFIKEIDKYGSILEIKKMGRMMLEKQLVRWAQKSNCTLSIQNASTIIDYVGEDLTALKNELEKLCALCKGRDILSQDIESIVSKNLEANIFGLSKSIIKKDIEKALMTLNVLFYNREEPIVILTILAGAYIDIYRTKVAKNSGENISVISDNFDYKGKVFKLDIAAKDGRNMTMDMVRKSINLLLDADKKLKSSKVDSKIILEQLVIELVKL